MSESPQQENARLREELEVAYADVESLQNSLNALTPLHRHIRATVLGRLGRADRGARRALRPRNGYAAPAAGTDHGGNLAALLQAAHETDARAGEAFAAVRTSSAALRGYERASRRAYAAALGVFRRLKRRLRAAPR